MIITIDGPAGSGKSTVAKNLAKKLACRYINSGLYYRKIAADTLGIEDPERLISAALKTDLQNIEESQLRSDEVSQQASLVASIKEIRELVTKQQRMEASSQNVIIEGRDAGTVVFPKADFKFFLTASLEERAKRRTKELGKDLASVQKMIEARDQADMQRVHSPLTKTVDSIEIDTTTLSIEQVIDLMIKIIGSNGEKNE